MPNDYDSAAPTGLASSFGDGSGLRLVSFDLLKISCPASNNREQPALRRPVCPRLAEISGDLAHFTRLAPFVRCNSPPMQM